MTLLRRTALSPTLYILSAALLMLSACGGDKGEIDLEKSASIHMERSLAYEQQGQYRAAVLEARNIINLDRTQPSGYERLAELYLVLGNYKSAATILERIQSTGEPDIELLLAETYNLQGKFLSAGDSLSRYRDAGGDINSSRYHVVYANTLAGQERPEEAIKLLKTINRGDINNIHIPVTLTTILLREELYEEAITVSNSTVKKFPNSPEALFVAGKIAFLQNDLDEAERLLTEAILSLQETDILLPLRLNILNSLSTVLTGLGRTTEALTYAKVIAKYSPEANDARIKFSLALELLNSGKIDEAEAIFEELYEAYPNNDKTAFYLGLINYHQGELASANSLFDQHLDTETTPPLLIEAAALSKLQLRQSNQAVGILEQALLIHDENPLLLGLYGVSILQKPESEQKALLAIQKSLAIDPTQVNLRLMLARFFVKKNNIEQAVAQLNLILASEPGNIPATGLYLEATLRYGEYEKAEKIADNLRTLHPNNPEALNLLGKFELGKKNIEQAKFFYSGALENDPENVEALSYLAYISIEEGNPDQAISYYQQIIQAEPDSPFAYKSLVTTLEASGKSEQALSTLSILTDDKQPENIRATANAVSAEYYLYKNQYNKAQEHLESALAMDTSTPYIAATESLVYYTLARQAYEQEDWASARKLLIEASNDYAEQVDIYKLLVKVELDSENLEEAQRLIDSLDPQYPEETFLILARADLYDLKGEPDRATRLLKTEWLKQRSSTLGRILVARLQPQPEEQARFLQDWVKIDPESDTPLTYLALNALKENDRDSAINYYQEAVELNPNSVSSLNNLAWLYYENNNPLATETAEKAYRLAPENAAVLDTYGWILVSTGETEPGIKLLEKALGLASPSELGGIQAHLDEARQLAL